MRKEWIMSEQDKQHKRKKNFDDKPKAVVVGTVRQPTKVRTFTQSVTDLDVSLTESITERGFIH